MKIHDSNYSRARSILNTHIARVCGLGLDDLPDTSAFADLSESLSDILDAHDVPLTSPLKSFPAACKELVAELKEIDLDEIMNMVE